MAKNASAAGIGKPPSGAIQITKRYVTGVWTRLLLFYLQLNERDMSSTANRGSPKSATRGGFTITVFRTGDELARAAASCVTSGLRQKQDLMIAAATGGSPTRTYEFLVQDYRKEPDLFKKLRIHKLDEWGDLDADDPGSCEAYLQQHLLAPLQIDHDR
jgi:hypothetical protein